jgi:hypothetical protein
MTTSHTAQGLASLGRHGDTMLVHMSPHEVAGLNYLAKKQGTSLTINPDTGLPEAFSLGGFFKSLLPTFVGAGMGFAGAPLWAGIAAGAATGAVTNRDNPLMGAAMGGLGGYGGMGIGSALSNTMAITNPAAAASTAGQTAISSAVPGAVGTTGQIGGANLIGSGVAGGTAASNAVTQNIMGAMNNAGVNIADPLAKDALKQAMQTVPKTSNFSGINMDPSSSFLKPTVFDQAYGTSAIQPSGTMGGSTLIGGGRDLANSAAAAQNPLIAASMSSSPTPGFGETFVDQLGGSSAAMKKLGLPLAGGVLGGLEPSDIYGNPINMDEARKKQAYDPYSSLNLGNDTGLRLVAKGGYIDGYAVGGTVTTGGLRDLYGTADNNTNPQLSRDGYGVGRLENLARQQAMTQAQTTGYAMGGPVSFADGGDAMKLQDEISPVDQGMGLTSLMPPATTPPAPGQAMPTGQVQNAAAALSDTASSDSSIIAQVANNLRTNPNYQPKNPIEASIVNQLKGTDPMQEGQPSQQGLGSIAPSQPMAPSFNPSVAMGPTYFAGMNAPRGYAHGGYLDGQGDGMSDSIPATIEGKQPARLADGEFVVPADVVSHLGNGSSKAGSKRLYAMLDKVRHARTGNKKQGKEIKADKYLPA